MLWLLKGGPEAPGWRQLEQDAKAGTTDVVHFDRHAWALVEAEAAPSGYEGFEAVEPPDGLYVDPNGSPLYLVAGRPVPRAEDVIEALGEQARALVEKLGDPDRVLERLGRAY